MMFYQEMSTVSANHDKIHNNNGGKLRRTMIPIFRIFDLMLKDYNWTGRSLGLIR